MNKTRCFALSSIILLAMAAKFAHAAPFVIQDQIDSAATSMGADYGGYSSANFENRVAGGKHWGDELYGASHRFDTTQITVDRNDASHTITFTMHTMFSGVGSPAAYADLFLDTATPNAPNTFNYAIALGSQSMAAGLYTVGSASYLQRHLEWPQRLCLWRLRPVKDQCAGLRSQYGLLT